MSGAGAKNFEWSCERFFWNWSDITQLRSSATHIMFKLARVHMACLHEWAWHTCIPNSTLHDSWAAGSLTMEFVKFFHKEDEKSYASWGYMRKTTNWKEWCAPGLLARCGGGFFFLSFFLFWEWGDFGVSRVKSVLSGEWDGAERCGEVLSAGAHIMDNATSCERWFVPLVLHSHALKSIKPLCW